MDARTLKIEAARAALGHVEDGMKLGIGTGSTAEEFVRLLAEKVAAGFSVVGVPTSERTARLCLELGVPLSSLDETPRLDLTIDGADEIDPALALIKGGGGALLREKIVASASATMIVIADRSKCVDVLGAFPLPIEINQFGLRSTSLAVESAAAGLGLSGPADNPDDERCAICYRRRPFHPRCIFWPHSRYKSALGRAPRHSRRRRARIVSRYGKRGDRRGSRRRRNLACPLTTETS